MSDQRTDSIRPRRARGERRSFRPSFRFGAVGFLFLFVLPHLEFLFFKNCVTLQPYYSDYIGNNLPPFHHLADRLGWCFGFGGLLSSIAVVAAASFIQRSLPPRARRYFVIIFLLLAFVFSMMLGYAAFVGAHRLII